MRVWVGELVGQPATDVSLEELVPLQRDLSGGREGTLLGAPALGCLAGQEALACRGQEGNVLCGAAGLQQWAVGGQRDSQVVLWRRDLILLQPHGSRTTHLRVGFGHVCPAHQEQRPLSQLEPQRVPRLVQSVVQRLPGCPRPRGPGVQNRQQEAAESSKGAPPGHHFQL